MANLSKTLHINFYQNRSSTVEVMIKKLVFFMPHSVDDDVVDVVVVDDNDDDDDDDDDGESTVSHSGPCRNYRRVPQ